MTKKTVEPRKYKLYFSFVPGIVIGFAVFDDDEGETAFEVSLGIVRFLYTKDVV